MEKMCYREGDEGLASNKENLMGLRFGRLTVVGEANSDKGHNAMWMCRCDCGEEKAIRALSLKSGETSSCGCQQGKYKHGMRGTRLYRIWCHMLARCQCLTDSAYPQYGGRGIAVCNEWATDFLVFANWALSHGYAHDLTIDRKDNNGGYNPDNCRWATCKEQANNRSNNIVLNVNGEQMTVAQWAEKLSISSKRVYERLSCGWTAAQAISIPVGGRRSNV